MTISDGSLSRHERYRLDDRERRQYDESSGLVRQDGANTVGERLCQSGISATISRHVRSRRLSAAEGRTTLDIFDKWLDGDAHLVNVSNDDIKMADLMVRDFDTKLLAPDAIHLAVAKRLGATLITFDARLAAAASLQNIAIEIPA